MKDKGDDEPRVIQLHINWGRLTVVFTILPAVLNFMGMVWALMDGNWESAFIMAAMVTVCVAATMIVWANTDGR